MGIRFTGICTVCLYVVFSAGFLLLGMELDDDKKGVPRLPYEPRSSHVSPHKMFWGSFGQLYTTRFGIRTGYADGTLKNLYAFVASGFEHIRNNKDGDSPLLGFLKQYISYGSVDYYEANRLLALLIEKSDQSERIRALEYSQKQGALSCFQLMLYKIDVSGHDSLLRQVLENCPGEPGRCSRYISSCCSKQAEYDKNTAFMRLLLYQKAKLPSPEFAALCLHQRCKACKLILDKMDGLGKAASAQAKTTTAVDQPIE